MTDVWMFNFVGKISIDMHFENCMPIAKINQVIKTNGKVNMGRPYGFKISRIAAQLVK